MIEPEKDQIKPFIRKKNWLRSFFGLILGSLLSGVALNLFYLPVGVTMGGVSGVAVLLKHFLPPGWTLSFGMLVALLNVPILILGVRQFGFRIIWRSFIGMLAYSAGIDVTAIWFSGLSERITGMHVAGAAPDPLVFCLVGGALFGLGAGLIVRSGYTTGGTDIVAFLLTRKIHAFSFGQIVYILDVIIVAGTMLTASAGQFDHVFLMTLYSFVAMFLSAKATDLAIEGYDYKRTAFIISSQAGAIADRIMHELNRGATLLSGRGAYSNEPRTVLICVLSSRQTVRLKEIVAEEDPFAFMFLSDSREVLGEGFERDDSFLT